MQTEMFPSVPPRRKRPVQQTIAPAKPVQKSLSILPFVHEDDLVDEIKKAQRSRKHFECETILTGKGFKAILDEFNNANSPTNKNKIRKYRDWLLKDYVNKGGSDCGKEYMKFDWNRGVSMQHRSYGGVAAAAINPNVNMRVRICVGIADDELTRTDQDKKLWEHIARIGFPIEDAPAIGAALGYLGNFYKTSKVGKHDRHIDIEEHLENLKLHYSELGELAPTVDAMHGRLKWKYKTINEIVGLGIPRSAAGAFLYIAYKINKKVAMEFVQTLMGEFGNKRHRENWVEFYKGAFPSGLKGYDGANTAFMLLCAAWNAYVDNNIVTQQLLREAQKDSQHNVDFPELKKPSNKTTTPRKARLKNG